MGLFGRECLEHLSQDKAGRKRASTRSEVRIGALTEKASLSDTSVRKGCPAERSKIDKDVLPLREGRMNGSIERIGMT